MSNQVIKIGNAPDKRTQFKHNQYGALFARAMAQEQRQAGSNDRADAVTLKTFFLNSGTVEEGLEREKIMDRVEKLACIILAGEALRAKPSFVTSLERVIVDDLFDYKCMLDREERSFEWWPFVTALDLSEELLCEVLHF